MPNIRFMGKMKTEADLTAGAELPAGAVLFDEGEDLNELFKLGFVVIMPVLIPVMIGTIIRIEHMEKGRHLSFDLHTVCVAAAAVVVYFLLKAAHETIHALFYPRRAKKTIWRYGSNGAWFCYCNAPVSRARFIVLSLAPMVILGILPFIVWLFAADALDTAVNIAAVVLIWMMVLFVMGDAANVYNTLKQVPQNACVVNYGLHSYWIPQTQDQ